MRSDRGESNIEFLAHSSLNVGNGGPTGECPRGSLAGRCAVVISSADSSESSAMPADNDLWLEDL